MDKNDQALVKKIQFRHNTCQIIFITWYNVKTGKLRQFLVAFSETLTFSKFTTYLKVTLSIFKQILNLTKNSFEAGYKIQAHVNYLVEILSPIFKVLQFNEKLDI